nr:immunoglobulin light chain junction region [Macaca mulatta]MOX17046.1 immunoglobulin light chain junction region [Macaca mulatta]MOX17833.1 immunoglobulin light chain junction region [Macaca mulatta]MOX18126.1 immunoglobulin light chain junction region [Macaca mulatta]MOX18600.1 immunoglobulin light chain junction region [Macaca mulatta]
DYYCGSWDGSLSGGLF